MNMTTVQSSVNNPPHLSAALIYDVTFKWTYIALVSYMLVAFARIQAFIPGLASLPLGMISAAFMVVAFLKESPSRSIFTNDFTREEKYFFGLFVMAILSIPGSIWRGHSFETVFKKFLPTLVMFYIVSNITRCVAETRKVLWIYFAMIAIILIAAIKGDISHGSLLLEMYDANDLSLVLVCALPFMLHFQKECKGLARLLLLGGIPLTVAVIILSGSRGGFLALLAIGIYFTLISNRKFTYALIAVALFIAISVMTPPETWSRLSTMWNPQSDYDRTAGDRTYVWKRALSTFANNPILGVGIGNFAVSDGKAKGGGAWQTAHNSLIQLGVEVGAIGLYFFVMLTLGTFLRMRRIRKELESPEKPHSLLWLVKAVEFSLLAYMVSGFFLSQAYSGFLYLILSLAVVAQKILAKENQAASLVL